jgi:hypothetical protein
MGESLKTTVVAGGIAGAAEVLLMFPLDTLKVWALKESVFPSLTSSSVRMHAGTLY